MKIHRFTNVEELRETIFRSPMEQYVLLALTDREIKLAPHAIRRMRQVAEDTDVSMVYAYYREENEDGTLLDHPVIQYTPGSVRDDFDFGGLVLLNAADILSASEDFTEEESKYLDGGWYALRLRMSQGHFFQMIPEYLYTMQRVDIIQGSIGFLSSAFDLFNSRDRKAEKSIKKHEEAVTRLGRAYTELQHAVDNALGETVYQNQSALIANLRQQQSEIRGMISDEYSKKKTDYAKIEEYQERIADANRQIEDIIAEITQSITQTSGKEASAQLMDAIINSCGEGKDALKSLNEVYKQVADDILKKAVANSLKLQFLEKPLQAAIKQLQKDMGFDEEGNGTFDGLSEDEQARFRAAVAAAGANFKAAMDMYKDLFAELDDSDPTSLSGAIKGASQESIDLLAGQTNAVRQNQVVSIEIFRQQLARLSSMDNRLGSIAGTLLSILNRLGIDDGDDLRSQGITD